MNTKILCFFVHAFPYVFHSKKDAKEMAVYLFTIIILTLFTLGVTLIDQSELPRVWLKLPQVRSQLPHLTGKLWSVFNSEYLQKNWSSLMEKVQNLKLIIILFYIQYKKVLAFLALIFGSSFEAIKRNKNLPILLKNSLI